MNRQAREIVANVIKFMKEDADGPTIPLKNCRERVLAATNISRKTYLQISKEATAIASNTQKKFSTPNKKRICSNLKSSMPEGAEHTLRSIIHDFTIIEKRRPTLKTK